MDMLKKLPWCKPDWDIPTLSDAAIAMLKQCSDLPQVELSDVDDVITRSKEFPVKFPIDTIRLEQLKSYRPLENLKRNIVSTYPVVHERALNLMAQFLIYKREFGSSIEKNLYKDMSLVELIDRFLKKRAVNFMGARDRYLLLTGETGNDGWEAIGTNQERFPLILKNCLSYDEMKLSAMLYVSGFTECINNGTRHNKGVVNEDNIETDAVIIGIIGPRFRRDCRMDCEDVIISKHQNLPENGYGDAVTPTTWLDALKNTFSVNNQASKHMLRQMWTQFYQVPSYTYEALSSQVTFTEKPEQLQYTERFVPIVRTNGVFDNEVYYKRLTVTAESALLEADARGKDCNKNVYLNIIGAGLGVWRVSVHQFDVYVLSFLERIQDLIKKNLLNHVTDVNFAYVEPAPSVLALFTDVTDQVKQIFLESKSHPKGGINVQLENREPSAKLTGEHEGKLLVMTYPWDGNAQPGNEFWVGTLNGSGDSAAASSTQVAELHNAFINPAVNAYNTRVVGTHGLTTLQEYCKRLVT